MNHDFVFLILVPADRKNGIRHTGGIIEGAWEAEEPESVTSSQPLHTIFTLFFRNR